MLKLSGCDNYNFSNEIQNNLFDKWEKSTHLPRTCLKILGVQKEQLILKVDLSSLNLKSKNPTYLDPFFSEGLKDIGDFVDQLLSDNLNIVIRELDLSNNAVSDRVLYGAPEGLTIEDRKKYVKNKWKAFRNLDKLDLSGTNCSSLTLKSLKCVLPNLKSIQLNNCLKLKDFPQKLNLPRNLTVISIKNSPVNKIPDLKTKFPKLKVISTQQSVSSTEKETGVTSSEKSKLFENHPLDYLNQETIIAINKSIADRNTSELRKSIYSNLTELIKNENWDIVEKYVHFLLKLDDERIPNRKFFAFFELSIREHVFNFFKNKFPDQSIDQFFVPIDKYKSDPKFHPGVYFTRKGIEFILKQCEQKGSLRGMPIHVGFTSFEDIDPELDKILKDFVEANGPQRCCMIAQKNTFSSSPEILNHYFPIYLEKDENNNIQVLITDASIIKKTDISNQLKRLLGKHALEKGIPINIKTYVSAARQFDVQNCGIFAIRDVLEISKDPEGVMSWVRKRTDNKEGSDLLPYVYFKNLPPRMMRVTQSYDILKKYERKMARKAAKGKEEALISKLSEGKHVRQNEKSRPTNYRITDDARKYEKMIWSYFFEQIKKF